MRPRQHVGGPPSPPAKPDYRPIYSSPAYFLRRDGRCAEGTYIESYIPANPYRDARGRLRAVVYLHGFSLGASRIYASHLDHLARQGYYVFYPNYQRGFCAYRPTLLGNLAELMREVLRPYPISPLSWMRAAVRSVAGAFTRAHLDEAPVETYLFGHSLGGLFALSWPHYAAGHAPAALLPRQILVADPIPDALSLIPAPVQLIARLLGAFADTVDIADTGRAIRVPVGILHGAEDKTVPAQYWQRPFSRIVTQQKTMYLSHSDDHGAPALAANHDQATVDTSFLPDWLASVFLDGSGVENNLDWRYVWAGLDQVLRYGARADQLSFEMGRWSDGMPVRPVTVLLRGKGP